MRDETGISHGASSGHAFPAELMLWLSPSFPTGGFAYSQGLETAVARGLITGREELRCWLLALLTRGMLWSDLVVHGLNVHHELRRRDVVFRRDFGGCDPAANNRE